MCKKKTTAKIIEQFISIHQNEYDYSLVNYVNDSTKVRIKCKTHGEFQQSPAGHFRMKQGCPKCSDERNGVRCRKKSDDVINQIVTIYGDEVFDFSKFRYVNAHTKVTLKCIKHDNWFDTYVGSLLKRKYGCVDCEADKRKYNQHNKWINKFINDSKLIHGDLYDYSKVVYTNGSTPVTISCKVHGEFQQLPAVHRLAKAGCPICKYSKGEHKIMQYLNDENITYTTQYKVKINDSKHYFDFYVPDYNLIIEYNGKQHYTPVAWFGNKNKKDMQSAFEYIQSRDAIKKEYCRYNNINFLSISYLEFNNIFTILDSKFKPSKIIPS